jgi:hypothetical protein
MNTVTNIITVNLFEYDEHLNFINTEQENMLVLVVYPAGDCDTFKWPLDTSYRSLNRQHENIIHAMYDAREMGHIPSDTTHVALPDSTLLSLND